MEMVKGIASFRELCLSAKRPDGVCRWQKGRVAFVAQHRRRPKPFFALASIVKRADPTVVFSKNKRGND
jgi:hypothetical protein